MTIHVDLGTLAELVDGSLAPGKASEARAHLRQCRSCMAAYVDAVRYRAAWLADPEAFRPDDDVRRWAESGGDGPRSSPRSSWVRLGGKVLQVSAAAVLVIWLAATLVGGAPTVRFELPPAVRDAVARSSERGLVLPGAAEVADRSDPELRSGQPVVSPA